jgi:hypothetical protein
MFCRLALIAGTLLASNAWAQGVATINNIQGAVTINQGEQFVGATSGQAVNASDRIMAADRASAVVTFADGCDLTVASGTLVTVPSTSPCAGGVPLVQSIAPSGGAVVGATGMSTGTRTALWVAGGALLAYGISEAVEDDDDTASP